MPCSDSRIVLVLPYLAPPDLTTLRRISGGGERAEKGAFAPRRFLPAKSCTLLLVWAPTALAQSLLTRFA